MQVFYCLLLLFFMASLVRPRCACETPTGTVSKVLELLEKQTAKEYHKIAVERAEEFIQFNIYQLLDLAVSDQSGRNSTPLFTQ